VVFHVVPLDETEFVGRTEAGIITQSLRRVNDKPNTIIFRLRADRGLGTVRESQRF